VVAVDDEPPALKAVQRLFEGVPDFRVAAVCTDPFAVESVVAAVDAQLVLLDVQMPGRTGFEVARALGAEPPELVFATAYDRFALQAFEAAAVDYLLKPIDPLRFAAMLDRVRARLRDRAARDTGRQVQALLERLASGPTVAHAPGAAPPRVAFKHGGSTTFIDPRSIDRIDADDNWIVVSIGAQALRVRETLSSALERLPQELFLRVSRSCVVNRARVVRSEPYFHGDVVLHLGNGTSVTSGRTYRRAVRHALGLDPEPGP
jgi:DNA-binding LytR/AlgR family response regulator